MTRRYFDRVMIPGQYDEATRRAMFPSPRADLVRHYLLADQPQPAECSTEIGADADDADPQLSAAVWRLYGAVLLVSVCALIVVVLA
jgi:hypothetical protein